MEEEQETVRGFSILKRPLNEEEKSRDITIERIQSFHRDAGEDFLDTADEADPKVFGGFIAHKYIDRASEVYEIMNENKLFLEINSFREFYDPEYNEEADLEQVYFDFIEFVNTTKSTKERVNQVLIQVHEYYNPEH